MALSCVRLDDGPPGLLTRHLPDRWPSTPMYCRDICCDGEWQQRKELQMSPSTVAGEAIGTAVRQVAMFAIWMILVAAVVVAMVSALRALRRREEAGLRDQAADHQAITRSALTRRTVRPGSRTRPKAAYASAGSGRRESGPDTQGVPGR